MFFYCCLGHLTPETCFHLSSQFVSRSLLSVYVVTFDNATSNHGNLVVRGYHVILRGWSSLQVFFFVDFRLNYVICAHLGQPSSIKVKHIVQLISGFYIQASYSVLTFSVVLHS